MSMTALDLLLHPVRLRIVNALSSRRVLTTGELCARLAGISQATVYRHVGMLVNGGILEVEGEQQVRGAVERRYRLCEERALIAPDEGKAMSRGDHRRAFGSAMAALIAEFNAYIARKDANPFEDLVGYRQGTVWLTEGEIATLIREIRGALAAHLANPPAPGRRPYMLSTIFFPIEDRLAAPGKAASRPKKTPSSKRP
ncbi:MAG: helix-turn-helix domain-containing protein [Gemmatimonadaceae bacterium]